MLRGAFFATELNISAAATSAAAANLPAPSSSGQLDITVFGDREADVSLVDDLQRTVRPTR